MLCPADDDDEYDDDDEMDALFPKPAAKTREEDKTEDIFAASPDRPSTLDGDDDGYPVLPLAYHPRPHWAGDGRDHGAAAEQAVGSRWLPTAGLKLKA